MNINKTVADTEGIAQETGKQFYWMSVLERKTELSTKIAELNAIKKQMEKKLACGDSETDEIPCKPSDSNESISARKSLRRVTFNS